MVTKKPNLSLGPESEVYSTDRPGSGSSVRSHRIPVTNEGDRVAENCRVTFDLDCVYHPYHPSSGDEMEISARNPLSWAEAGHPTSIDINPGETIEFDFLQLRERETGWHVVFASPEGWESGAPLQITTENEGGNFTRNGEEVSLESHTEYVETDPETGQVIHHHPMPHENLFKEKTGWNSRIINMTGANFEPIQKEFQFDWEGGLTLRLT